MTGTVGIEARRQVPRGAKWGGTEGEGRRGAKNTHRMAMVSLGMLVWLSYGVKTFDSLLKGQASFCGVTEKPILTDFSMKANSLVIINEKSRRNCWVQAQGMPPGLSPALSNALTMCTQPQAESLSNGHNKAAIAPALTSSQF